MWTEITRLKYRRDGLRYASDMTDAEWAVVEPMMPSPRKGRGRRRTTPLRSVLNAIFYIAQSGCQWRMLPKDFPPFTTVQHYFYPWRGSGLWRQINHVLVMRAREAEGREASPSAGVVERTFAWLNRNRRLAKDFETSIESALAWLMIASVKLLTRRLTRI